MSKSKLMQGTLLAFSIAALGAGCSTSHPRYYATETTSSRYTGSTGTTPGSSYATSANPSATQTTEAQQSGNTVIPLYQESVRVGTREVDAGSVRLRKVVTTETVNQPVQLRRETLVIDRAPAGAQPAQGTANFQQSGAPGQAFQEQDMVIHLKREEPVVETQVIQTGQIVAEKKSQTQQQNVQRQVRHEDIQVEKIGNPENVVISENLRGSVKSESTGAGGATGGQSQGTGGSSPNQP